MYRSVIRAKLPVEILDAQTVYRRLKPLIALLADIHPGFQGWVEQSRGSGAIPFADEARFIEMVAFNAKQDGEQYPTTPTAAGAGANITQATTKKEWESPGCTEISYTPWFGSVTLTINEPIEAFGDADAPRIIRQCVAAIAATMDTPFIGTDVVCPLPGGKGYDTYSHKHQLFPHRRWLGWMGFVPELVPRKFIPEAAAMEVVKGKGTIIVAVDECFDLRNNDHLKRAHQVELRMANAGLLDIIDPSLL
jgi:hypothetical protein